MPTPPSLPTAHCPLPTKISPEPKTQIKKKKKKKKPPNHCHIQPIWTQKIKINPCLTEKHTQNPHKTQIGETIWPMAPPDQRRHQCRQRHTISSLSSVILSNRSLATLVTHQSPRIQTHTTTWPMIHWSTYPNPSLNPQLQTYHLTHNPHSSPIQTQPTTITDLYWSTPIQNPKSKIHADLHAMTTNQT